MTTDAKFMCECLRHMGLGTCNTAADLIEQQAALIAALESRLGAQAGEPVGEVGSIPGTDGFTMACFKASEVPVGTKLYASPVDSAMAKDAELLREVAALNRYDPNTVLKYDIKVLHVSGDLLRRIDAALTASEPKKTGE